MKIASLRNSATSRSLGRKQGSRGAPIWLSLPSSQQRRAGSIRAPAFSAPFTPSSQTCRGVTVDHTSARAGLAADLFSTRHRERMVYPPHGAVVVPEIEIIKQHALGRRILWNIPPLAPCAEHVHQTVHDFSNTNASASPAALGARRQRLIRGSRQLLRTPYSRILASIFASAHANNLHMLPKRRRCAI